MKRGSSLGYSRTYIVAPKKRAAMSNFATLDSVKKKKEEDSKKQGAEYYSGGAGAQGGSGLNVVDPEDGEGDKVEQIFARAAAEGSDGAAAAGEAGASEAVTLTFYRNGFTLGDGPLREQGTPENDQFVDEIKKGFCPSELIVDGKPAHVKIEDKRGEDFAAPAYVAFSGGGQSAGAGAAVAAASSGSVVTPSAAGAKSAAPAVDEAEPTVRVQIVYAHSRKRAVVKFNKTHVVQDLIAVIDASNEVSAPYQMLTSQRGPPRPIPATDFAKTIPDAGLAGAAVTVKLV